jgi:hypothetical protein
VAGRVVYFTGNKINSDHEAISAAIYDGKYKAEKLTLGTAFIKNLDKSELQKIDTSKINSNWLNCVNEYLNKGGILC